MHDYKRIIFEKQYKLAAKNEWHKQGCVKLHNFINNLMGQGMKKWQKKNK